MARYFGELYKNDFREKWIDAGCSGETLLDISRQSQTKIAREPVLKMRELRGTEILQAKVRLWRSAINDEQR
jgi:hypothetical protein